MRKRPEPTAEDWIILRLTKDLVRAQNPYKTTTPLRSITYLVRKLGWVQLDAMLTQLLAEDGK
jgi:hypothetical protein